MRSMKMIKDASRNWSSIQVIVGLINWGGRTGRVTLDFQSLLGMMWSWSTRSFFVMSRLVVGPKYVPVSSLVTSPSGPWVIVCVSASLACLEVPSGCCCSPFCSYSTCSLFLYPGALFSLRSHSCSDIRLYSACLCSHIHGSLSCLDVVTYFCFSYLPGFL